MSAAGEDEGGFDICSVSLSRNEDRGPLQMISGERLAQFHSIETAAVGFVVNPTPDNWDQLVAVIRQSQPLEKS